MCTVKKIDMMLKKKRYNVISAVATVSETKYIYICIL